MKVKAKLTKTYDEGVPSYRVAVTVTEIYAEPDAEESLSKMMEVLGQTILRDASPGTSEKKKPLRK